MEEAVVVAGAGPTGIACAIELGRRGDPAVCYDRGGILDSIQRFPEEMRWFSTRDLLDIAGVPFAHTRRASDPARDPRVLPRRRRALRRPRRRRRRTIERVTARPGGGLDVEASGRAGSAPAGRRPPRSSRPASSTTRGGSRSRARTCPHVHSRYVSGFPFHGRDVVVVGGKNSAAEAALDLYRHGARVTLVHRGDGAVGAREVLDQAGPREPHRRRRDPRALRLPRPRDRRRRASASRRPPGEAVVPRRRRLPAHRLRARLRPLRALRHSARGRGAASRPTTRRRSSRTSRTCTWPGRSSAAARSGRIFIENSRHHAARIAGRSQGRRQPVGPVADAATNRPPTRVSGRVEGR